VTGKLKGISQLRIAYARSWEYDGNWEKYEGTKYSLVINVTS
jgi:hypothetical protein